MRYIVILLLFVSAMLDGQNREALQHEKPLQIAVYESAPFGMMYSDGAYGGLMVGLWKDIAKDLGYNYEFYQEDMAGLLTGIENGRYDVGLGALSITPKREKYVDFTQPVNPSGTGYALSINNDESGLSSNSWYKLFISLLKLLGSLIVMLLISGIVVWLVEKDYDHEDPEKGIKSIYDALWWSAVTMTTVGYGDKVPRSMVGKLLGIIWIFASILLLSLFTANASAILAQDHNITEINTVDDLRKLRVGAAAKSSGQEFLTREHIEHTAYKDVYEALDDMELGRIDVVVNNAPVLYYINKHEKKYIDKLVIGDKLLVKNNMGIALPDNSPLEEDINRTILQLISEHKWQYEMQRYLGDFER